MRNFGEELLQREIEVRWEGEGEDGEEKREELRCGWGKGKEHRFVLLWYWWCVVVCGVCCVKFIIFFFFFFFFI